MFDPHDDTDVPSGSTDGAAPFDLEASSSVELEASLVMLATRWRVDIGTVSEVAPPPTPSKGHAVVTGKTPPMSQ